MEVFLKSIWLKNCRYFIFKIFKNLRWSLLKLKTATESIFNMSKRTYIALELFDI